MFKVQFKDVLIIFSIILLGISTSFYKGYGDDLDSHSLILSFINAYENGVYSPSRFYGSPLGEIFYGFLGYNFGSFVGSIFSFCFFLISIILFFLSFAKNKINKRNIYLFILICFSNPVLYLDNTNPSDYPLTLLFFSVAIYLFRNNNKMYSILFFGLTVATKANYALFIIAFLIYEFYSQKKNLKLILIVFFYSFLIGSLFYLPIFIQSKLSLSFISNSGGPDLTLKVLTPRFFYKIYLAMGIFSSILISFIFLTNYKKLKKLILVNIDIFVLLVLNLLVFYFMPTKTSIISLVIILIYILLFKIIDKKIYLYLVIIFNLSFYLISYEIFDFKYKYSGKCDPIHAIGAKLNLKLSEGYFFKRTKFMENQIECASYQFGSKSQRFINGKKIK